MEITAEEKRVLEQVYGKSILNVGYIPNQIENIRKLTEDESIFFERKNFVSPHFYVQTLYKIQGEILPLKFNHAVHSLIEEDENFRANFCNVGTRTLKIIFRQRKIIPDVVFRFLKLDAAELDETLTKIMEADRRLDFDIQRGNLIRFSVFRTGENESAVLVTISQLIAKRFDSKSFFKAVLNDENYRKFEPVVSSTVPQIENRVKEYWTGLLKNFPAPSKIPFSKKIAGTYVEENYRVKIPADIFSDLRGKAQSNRVMLMTIFQTAWGFLLQAANNSTDTAFCQIISNTKTAQIFSLNAMPVRLKISGDLTVENIITKQFKQLVISQPYSFFDWSTLENLTSRKGNLFDHFLSFLDFNAEKKFFSQVEATPEGKIVVRNSWDSQGMKLGVYFQYAETNLSVSFQYDKNQFFQNAGERLANMYGLILRQMLVYWNAPFADFVENIKKIAAEISTVKESSQEGERKIIIDFISKNKMLQSESTGSTAIFVENSKLITHFEGDRISGDILDKNLVFVVEGKLSRSLDIGDGWFNALDIIKAGGLLNENIFLEKRRAIISAEVLTEKAVLLLIPLANFESATRQTPALYKSILQHVVKQMEKYQILWLQS